MTGWPDLAPGLTFAVWYSQSRNPRQNLTNWSAEILLQLNIPATEHYLASRISRKVFWVTFDSKLDFLNHVSDVNTKIKQRNDITK